MGKFILAFGRNLLLLALLVGGLYIFYPAIIGQAYGMLGDLLGPILILVVLGAAFPKRWKGK